MESMVGGVAMLDFDADGLLDLFLVNGAALADPMPEGDQYGGRIREGIPKGKKFPHGR